MIRSRRRIDCSTLGALHETIAWMDTNVRAELLTTRRVTCDDGLRGTALGPRVLPDRASARIVLAGRAWVCTGTRVIALGVGDGVVVPPGNEMRVRTEGLEHQSLTLAWSPSRGARRTTSFVAPDLDAVLRVAEAMANGGAPDPQALDRVARSLQPASVRLAAWHLDRGMAGTCEERAQRLIDALDVALSSLDAQPMTTDLERQLGICSRQLTRRLMAFHRRYGSCETGWLELRHRHRLSMAATLLTAPDATVAAVARLVGYRSPETLARAFALAGLPRPSRVRAHVAALGDVWRARAAQHRAPWTERSEAG